ncbi:MAG TPA: hypothetical protein V6C84_30185 [Coleofasciculaceae cyanobacterium]|jgi:hypothetical protein
MRLSTLKSRTTLALASAFVLTTLMTPQSALAEIVVPVEQVIGQLSQSTDVPILLPTELPVDFREVYLEAQSNTEGYNVSFYPNPACRAGACYYGGIEAKRGGQLSENPFTLRAPRDLGSIQESFETVALADGTQAQFINQCGAYCTARLEWQSQDVLYQVTVKNGRRDDLVAIANSAMAAGDRTSDDACSNALASAQQRLEEGRTLTIGIRQNDISNQYPDHPEGRTSQYMFVLSGRPTLTILNSPQFMRSISSEIIENCDSVGIVSFIQWNSDGPAMFGIMPSGQVEGFHCLERNRRSQVRPQWGQEVCI